MKGPAEAYLKATRDTEPGRPSAARAITDSTAWLDVTMTVSWSMLTLKNATVTLLSICVRHIQSRSFPSLAFHFSIKGTRMCRARKTKFIFCMLFIRSTVSPHKNMCILVSMAVSCSRIYKLSFCLHHKGQGQGFGLHQTRRKSFDSSLAPKDPSDRRSS